MTTIEYLEYRAADWPDVVYWAPDGSAMLYHDHLDAAVDAALNRSPGLDEVLVAGFQRVRPFVNPSTYVEMALSLMRANFIQIEPVEPTLKMHRAAERFAEVMLREYDPRPCEIAVRVRVRIAEWRMRARSVCGEETGEQLLNRLVTLAWGLGARGIPMPQDPVQYIERMEVDDPG